MKMATNNPTKQANVKAGRGGVIPPADKQFGKPGGNPRHNGAWKKESTLRYKWEKILEMDEPELKEVLRDPKCGRVEQMTAEVLLDRQMKPTEKIAVLDKLATQIYGQPKQKIEQTVIAPKPLIDLTERNKNGQE
jgi:hypothetical protein